MLRIDVLKEPRQNLVSTRRFFPTMRSRLENRFPDDFSYLSRGFDGTCKILVELVFSVRRILNGQLSRFFPQTFYQTPYSFFLSWRIAVISYEYTRVRSYHTTRFGRKYPFWTELKVFFLRFFRFFFPIRVDFLGARPSGKRVEAIDELLARRGLVAGAHAAVDCQWERCEGQHCYCHRRHCY